VSGLYSLRKYSMGGVDVSSSVATALFNAVVVEWEWKAAAPPRTDGILLPDEEEDWKEDVCCRVVVVVGRS